MSRERPGDTLSRMDERARALDAAHRAATDFLATLSDRPVWPRATLDEMVDRLADDHARAARLARAAGERWPDAPGPGRVRTNIVRVEHPAPERVVDHLAGAGVLAGTVGPGVLRLVTHHDVDDAGVDVACRAIGSCPW